MQPLQICIGPIIRIGRESWCLPYAGFFPNRSAIRPRSDKADLLGSTAFGEHTSTHEFGSMYKRIEKLRYQRTYMFGRANVCTYNKFNVYL